MAVLIRRYTKETEEFHRQFTWSQEDRRKRTNQPWPGGYRWFKSPNITPIEYYRRINIQDTTSKRAG
jgi:hypothetical protein